VIDYSKWSSNLAYAVGLIASDGNLSSDGRHIDLTSKDIEQLENFQKCLEITHKISIKKSGYSDKEYSRIQFSDVKFYRWLNGIGMTSKKSKTIANLKIPNRYFFDFLRGQFDGDGCSYSYWDKRWHSSFMIYVSFVSASKDHMLWMSKKIEQLIGFVGRIDRVDSVYRLRYAKNASIVLFEKMYADYGAIALTRKKTKVQKALDENK